MGPEIEEHERARAEGKDLLLDVDVQGAAQVRERMPDAVTVFILPPVLPGPRGPPSRAGTKTTSLRSSVASPAAGRELDAFQ